MIQGKASFKSTIAPVQICPVHILKYSGPSQMGMTPFSFP